MNWGVSIKNGAASLIRRGKGEVWMAIWKMIAMGFYCVDASSSERMEQLVSWVVVVAV